MKKIIEYLKSNKFNVILSLCYLFITIILMFHHEIWRDEAQVWCLVRDLPFNEIIKTARLEGHPVLWYLMIMPFAKIGLPVISMQIISLLFVFAGVGLLIFKSPLTNLQKILVVFSSGLVYHFPIIARNYALIPLFLFLLAYFYRSRKEKPYKYVLCLILLSNTHLLMLGFCGISALLFTVEKAKETMLSKDIKRFIPVLFAAINFLLIFLIFIHTPQQNQSIYEYSQEEIPLVYFVLKFIWAFSPYLKGIYTAIDVILFPIILCITAISLFKGDKKLFIVFTGSFLYLFLVFLKVWFGGIVYQKAFILYLIILFCYWVCDERVRTKAFNIVIMIIFIINFVYGIFDVYKEIKAPFSSAKETAEYIKENTEKDSTICAVGKTYLYTGINAYLPERTYYSLSQDRKFTFHDFNNSYFMKKEKPVCKYYIMPYKYNVGKEFKLLYSSDKYNIINKYAEEEIFKIYEKQ